MLKKIYIIGDLCLDVIVPYNARQKDLSKETGIFNFVSNPNKVIQRSGGSSANVAVVLSKLGMTPYLVTMEGNDEAGKYLKDQMLKQGVNMDYSIASDHGSIVCIAIIDENNERKIFTWCPEWSNFDDFKPEYFDAIYPDENSIFYFSGIIITHDEENINAVLHFLERAKRSGSKIVFDLNLRADAYGVSEKRMNIFKRAVKISDYVLGSGLEEFGPVSSKYDSKEAVDSLKREDLVIIERNQGDPVNVYIGKDWSFSVPVPKVEQVNTIGAGDTFNAAFLSKISQNVDIKKSVEFANYIASYKVSSDEHLAVPSDYNNF